jgi:hypothetical protein
MKRLVVLAAAAFLAFGAQAATGHHISKAHGKPKATSHHVAQKAGPHKHASQKHAAGKNARKSGHKQA